MMEKLKPFPVQKNVGYNNGAVANDYCQPLLTPIECYSIASSLSSKPTEHNNPSYFSGVSAQRRFTKVNPKVNAFGPKHAEKARRFYQLERRKPELRLAMIPPTR